MLLGCDLKQLDEFTLNLLTNDEVLAVNQDPLGKQAAQLAKEGTAEVWAKDMEDGAKAVGLFNLGPAQAKVVAKWPALGLKGKQLVRDLWRQKDVGVHDEQFEADVPSHGVVMVKMSAVK
jgi:alpha-galactosidase